MDKLYFDNNADENAEIDFQQMQLYISRSFAQLANEFKPMYDELFKSLSSTVSHTISESFQKAFEPIKNAYTFSPEVVKTFQERIKGYCKEFPIPQNDKEVSVHLDDKQLEVLEAVYIPVNDYSNSEKSDKNNKIMSVQAIFILISLITTIITLVTTTIENNTALVNNDTARVEYKTAELNNDTVHTQFELALLNDSQDDKIDTLLKTANELIEKYNESTSDEITSSN
jgi:hypothetical protein|nr:MAG: hypothetical protein [Bacteriophage sp.]